MRNVPGRSGKVRRDLVMLLILGGSLGMYREYTTATTSLAATSGQVEPSAYMYRVASFSFGDPQPSGPDRFQWEFLRRVTSEFEMSRERPTVEVGDSRLLANCQHYNNCDAVTIQEDVKTKIYSLVCLRPAHPSAEKHGKLQDYPCNLRSLDDCREEAASVLADYLPRHHRENHLRNP